jgi:hypothetical protein
MDSRGSIRGWKAGTFSLDLLHNPFRGLTAVLGTPLRLEFLKRRLCKRSIIKADRRDAIVVLPLRLAADIAVAAERGKP